MRNPGLCYIIERKQRPQRIPLFDQRIKFVETLSQQVLDRLALAKAVGELGTQQLDAAMSRLARLTGA